MSKTRYNGPTFYTMIQMVHRGEIDSHLLTLALRSARDFPAAPRMRSDTQRPKYEEFLSALVETRNALPTDYQSQKQARIIEDILSAYRESHESQGVPLPDALRTPT